MYTESDTISYGMVGIMAFRRDTVPITAVLRAMIGAVH